MSSQNETLITIHSLRSTHGDFSEKEISAEDVQTIVTAAVRAANASARQSYSIVVVEDRELMKKLCGHENTASH
jgi:nitroreductase